MAFPPKPSKPQPPKGKKMNTAKMAQAMRKQRPMPTDDDAEAEVMAKGRFSPGHGAGSA